VSLKTKSDISSIRLINQQIAGSQFGKVQDLVGWMGAMQAQDFNMLKWAVGIRIPESTNQAFLEAFNQGKVIRTHLLRPTWHLVSSNDFYWMLDLTSPHLKIMLRRRLRELELTQPILNKSKSIIEKILGNGNFLTREEIMVQLENSGISTTGQRAPHILMDCELDGMICSGPLKEKKQTYALAEERVSVKNLLSREESLFELAHRYFTSHGPASLQDFIWWSGLPVRDARKALEMIKPDFASIESESQIYWFSEKTTGSEITIPDSAFIIPAFDEFIISYRDRSDAMLAEHHKKAISNNGVFRPTVVVNGKVVGIWRSNKKRNKVVIETEYFHKVNKKEENLVREASEKYGRFLDQDIEIVNRVK
jgi:hypothetical protein